MVPQTDHDSAPSNPPRHVEANVPRPLHLFVLLQLDHSISPRISRLSFIMADVKKKQLVYNM